MYKMNKNIIIQETEKVLAQVELSAYDNRTGQVEDFVLYCELTAEDQDALPIVNRALKCLGYQNCGIKNVVTASMPFDAKECFYKSTKS